MSAYETTTPVDRIMCADSLDRTLLAVMARDREGALSRVPLLGRRGHLPVDERRAALARDAGAEAVPHEAAGAIDAEEVAAWIAAHYPAAEYPAAVLGSPHGAAVHLAAAIGAAWLPTAFRVTLTWPGGDAGDWPAAMEWGSRLAARIVARNPGITVRQVHDPLRRGPVCAATVSLHLRWRHLPGAYRDLLRDRIAFGGAALLLRDLRTWPVVTRSPRFGFQLGSPAGGWSAHDYTTENPALCALLDDLGTRHWPPPSPASAPRYAETAGEPAFGVDLAKFAAEIGLPVHRALYTTPAVLSASVADLYRRWLRAGGAGDRCVIESGRLLDPWQALAGGVVPYWSESAAHRDVESAEWWLAGSESFDAVTVLPDAPGHAGDPGATLAHWRSLTSFGRCRGALDRQVAGRYPALPVAAGHATRVLAEAGGEPGTPPTMTMLRAVRGLRRSGSASGMMVS